MWIANAERTRELDRRAANEFGLTAPVLMERAGMAVFRSIQEMLPDGGRVTVFCGKGNNGGDGFVVARLALEAGYLVDCLVAAEEHELGADCDQQMRIARLQGVDPIFYSDARWSRKSDCVGCRDLIVDAVLGTGAKAEVRGAAAHAIKAINESGVPVVSVDVPSGICCDTGEELGESVWALKTITFGLPKPFLFQGLGLENCGHWSVADIGYPSVLLTEPTDARLIDQEHVANLLPERLKASHKGENGHLLIVAGSRRYRGAATLATLAAMRSGAGLVTLAGVPDVCAAVTGHIPEAIVYPLPEINGVIAPEAADIVMELAQTAQAAVFGPGMTQEDPVIEFFRRVWRYWELPMVADADALNAIADGIELPEVDVVMTPHPGEMSRLLHCSTAEVQADRFVTVRHAIERYRRTILLKGPYSIVGEDDAPMLVNRTGNPGQASAGMGDVLTGVIGTLLAQQLPAYDAASCGMYWHGYAADLCAQEIGSIGFTAGDVARALPQARARIVSTCGSSLASS